MNKENTKLSKNSLSITSETKPDKKRTRPPVWFQNISRTGTIHPGISESHGHQQETEFSFLWDGLSTFCP